MSDKAKSKCATCGYEWITGMNGAHNCAEKLVGRVRVQQKETKKLKKYLKDLTVNVRMCLAAIDKEMEKPSDENRGKRIAKICNTLEMANDEARYFGIGIDYRTDKKGK